MARRIFSIYLALIYLFGSVSFAALPVPKATPPSVYMGGGAVVEGANPWKLVYEPLLADGVAWAATAAGGRVRALLGATAVMGTVLGAIYFGSNTADGKATDGSGNTPVSWLMYSDKNHQTANPDTRKYSNETSPSDPLQKKPIDYFAGISTTPKPSSYNDIVNAGGGWYQNSKIADIYYTAFPAPDYVDNYGNTIYNSCAAPSLTATHNDMTKGFCGKVNGVNYAVYYVITNRICETGRTLDSATGNCVVKEEANSMKPANQMPCEVTKRTDGSLYIDPRNPVCSDLASKIKTSADGKKITFESGMEKVTVTDNDDASRVLDFQFADNWQRWSLSPHDSSKGGRTVTKVESGAGTNPYGDAGGQNGNGGLGCGDAKNPCQIDDSGFKGRTVSDTTGTELNKAKNAYKDQVATGQGDHGITADQILGQNFYAPKAACENPFLDFGNFGADVSRFSFSLPICDNEVIKAVRMFLSWAVYSATLLYVWRKLTNSEGGSNGETK